MSVNHSQTLFSQFETNLKAQPKLTRAVILETFQKTVDAYFQSLESAPVVGGAPAPSKSKSKSKKDSDTVTEKTNVPPNSQWPKIYNSKDFGVTTFFASEYLVMKEANKSLNYFSAIKALREKHEGSDQWTAYLTWVRSVNPDAPANDPPART